MSLLKDKLFTFPQSTTNADRYTKKINLMCDSTYLVLVHIIFLFSILLSCVLSLSIAYNYGITPSNGRRLRQCPPEHLHQNGHFLLSPYPVHERLLHAEEILVTFDGVDGTVVSTL